MVNTKSTLTLALCLFASLSSAPLMALEFGRINALTDVSQTILLNNAYVDPIVVAGPASYREEDPGVVVVSGISSNSFEIRFKEWDYLDGSHAVESVSYIVMERGTVTLPSGAILHADTADLGASWYVQTFPVPFSNRPVLLTTVASENFAGTVAPRIDQLTGSRFRTRYWRQESTNTTHGTEDLNWIAISRGQDDGALDGFAWESLDVITDERFKVGNFSNVYSNPCIIADVSTPTSNPFTVRHRNAGNESVEFVVQEERSKDQEVLLGVETINSLVVECGAVVNEDDETPPMWNATAIQASDITDTSMTVSWTPGATDNIAVTGYEFFIDGTAVGTTSNTSWLLSGLSPNNTYAISVDAFDAADNRTTLAGSVITATEPDTTPPQWNGASLQKANSTDSSLTISWAPGATDNIGVTGYELRVDNALVTTTSDTSYQFTELTAQTSVTISVFALDLAGNATELSGSFTTDAPPPDNTDPEWNGVSVTVANVTSNAFDLDWAPGATDNVAVTAYNVLIDGNPYGTTITNGLSVTGLTAETLYTIDVIATDANGNTSAINTSATTAPEPPTGNNPVETGVVLALTDQFTTVQLGSAFTDPVVVAGPASSNDADPGLVVIDNITSSSFDARFREWNYQDGTHAPESIYYMVVERGTTTLPSGALIQAGTVSASSSVWGTTSFDTVFPSTPVLLTTIASAYEPGTVAPRVNQLSNSLFKTRTWVEEGNSAHGSEDLNWIAISTGSHDGSADGFAWETLTVTTDENFETATFANNYTNACVVADINSLTPNPATLRHRDFTNSSIDVHLQEEQANDSEVVMGNESISLLVTECIEFDETPPVWPNAFVNITAEDAFSVEIDFSTATDENGISHYVLYRDGLPVSTTQTNSFLFTGLEPNTSYIFAVEAADVFGNVSFDGPDISHTTDIAPLGRIAGILWADGDLNGSQNNGEPGLPGGTITLALNDGSIPDQIDDTNTQIVTTTSQSDGSYEFRYLAANNYLVATSTPAGYLVENPTGPVAIELGVDQEVDQINFPFSIDPNAILGTPFGVFSHLTNVDFTFSEYNAVRFHLGSVEEATYFLDLARATNTKVIINLALKQEHINPSGTFNWDLWTEIIDRFQDFDFSPYVNDGTIIAHYLIDEPKARGSWGGQAIHNQVLDNMAGYSKQYWPYMPTTLRMQPTKLALHAGGWNQPIPTWEWQHLDSAWAQYNSRQVAVVQNYINQEVQSAADQDLGLVFGLQAMVGGNGSSGLHPEPPFNVTKWTMSANEIVNYTTAMLEEEASCMFLVFRYDRYDETHFLRPEIAQAMSTVKTIAEQYEPTSCGVRIRD